MLAKHDTAEWGGLLKVIVVIYGTVLVTWSVIATIAHFFPKR